MPGPGHRANSESRHLGSVAAGYQSQYPWAKFGEVPTELRIPVSWERFVEQYGKNLRFSAVILFSRSLQSFSSVILFNYSLLLEVSRLWQPLSGIQR